MDNSHPELIPFAVLIPAILVIILVAWRRRAFPTRRAALVMLVPALVSLSVLFEPYLRDGSVTGNLAGERICQAVLALDLAVFVLLMGDLIGRGSPRQITVEREVASVQSLRGKSPVTLHVANQGPRTVRLAIRDDVPETVDAQPNQFSLEIPPRNRATLGYELCPTARGRFRFERIDWRMASPWGMWELYHRAECPAEIRVYPDLKQLREYALLARTNRLAQLGLRKTRRIGQDHDFERLREFTRDDNHKHIDWRSTARRQRLMVKDFQATRSQRVILMLDCGRMMTNESSGVTLFDHAINASLMLAHVALSGGDSVGMLVFSDHIHAYIPPRSGLQQMNRLLHALFDRFPQMVESRYDEAFLYLTEHCRRRSLIVLTSNVIDEINGKRIEDYLGNLTGPHLPLGVLLRDRQIFQYLDDPQPAGERLYQAAAAAEIVQWRHQVLVALRKRGALMLDVFPEQITAPLINQYLEVKARHLL